MTGHASNPNLQGDHLRKRLRDQAEHIHLFDHETYGEAHRREWLNEWAPKKPTVYIAGPMSGHQDFNYHAFHYAAHDLRAAGHTTLNPAENPKPNPNPTWQDWMRVALGQLIQADAIALLPGWHLSKGAMIEERIGRDLGLDVRPIEAWLMGQKPSRASLYTPSASSK